MIIPVNIDVRLINEAYRPLLTENAATQILYGGSSSGKSKFQAQRTVSDLLQGRNYLVTRKVGVTLRTSAFNEICKIISEWRLAELFRISRSDLTITCSNGAQAIFKGLDDVEKIKSITPETGVITDIWIEEATEAAYDEIKQLKKRLRGRSKFPKRMHLTFNPIAKQHWIYKEFFAGRFMDDDTWYRDDDVLILKTTHKDNEFLTSDDRAALENEKDEYFYNVYTLGNWGILGNLILTNWRVEDLADRYASFGNYRNGLDFGYTNDPTAHVRFSIKPGKRLFVTDGFYEYGMTNPAIAGKLKPVIGDEYIRCDAAEPKSIAELRSLGINAMPATKGPGSVNQGIQFLKQHEIIIDKRLQFMINECGLYQWRKNRDGEVMNEPVDKFNHAVDALRYGVSDLYRDNISYDTTYSPAAAGVVLP